MGLLFSFSWGVGEEAVGAFGGVSHDEIEADISDEGGRESDGDDLVGAP